MRPPVDTEALIEFVRHGFERLADPSSAPSMARYMKTDMPLYGIKAPQREPVIREMLSRFPTGDEEDVARGVAALWSLPHREERYAALAYAINSPYANGIGLLGLYERLIREGAWWDLVDATAIKLVGAVLRQHPSPGWAVVDGWIDDPHLWVRRSTLICQIDHGVATDRHRLFGFCLRRSHEPEFFIRKAIGWALREYSYVAAQEVAEFLTCHREQLSGLSYREGAKGLVRRGLPL